MAKADHAIIFEVDQLAQIVNVLHIFHTKQDIQGRSTRGEIE